MDKQKNIISISTSTNIVSKVNIILSIVKIELLFKQNKVNKAIKEITILLRKNPKNDYLFYLRGSYLISIKKYKKGLADLSKVSKKSKYENSLYTRRGFAYFMLDKNDQAEIEFKKTLKRDPKNIEALTYYGFLLISCYDFRKAKILFKKIQKIDPKNSIGKIYSGYCGYILGNKGDDVKFFEQITKRSADISLKQSMFFDLEGKFHYTKAISHQDLKNMAMVASKIRK